MSSTSVTVLVAGARSRDGVASTVRDVEQFLQTTGFEFTVVAVEDRVCRAALEASNGIVVIVDGDLPYSVAAIGDAVARIESGTADVVFGARSAPPASNAIVRWLLVDLLPDPSLQLKAFSADAARLLFGEVRLEGRGADLEIAYLANKYGLRIEYVLVETANASRSVSFDAILPALRIRLNDRRNAYRAPRRCPVCFSSEVWSCAQIPGNVVRACGRCKCRYLNRIEAGEEQPVQRVLRSHATGETPVGDALDETMHGRTAREKTSQRRLKMMRAQLPPRGRILEIGVRDGSFGAAAAREYEYVGIDRAQAAARAGRGRGLEVYCSTLMGFVNTGPAFDAVTLYHVFESMTDPHDALARVKDLLKPGGALVVSAIDTEGFGYLLSERTRAAQNFRTRVILYSRSALIELLERSGFEIVSIGPEFEYRDHRFLRHRFASGLPAALARAALTVLPDPLLISSGSVRIIARRRAGAPVNMRPIRSVEPTHAR
jgi:2-polyprenyl-3-methyl-5-hydroxy-6-metoxy-1,4-benzoquinol methylase